MSEHEKVLAHSEAVNLVLNVVEDVLRAYEQSLPKEKQMGLINTILYCLFGEAFHREADRHQTVEIVPPTPLTAEPKSPAKIKLDSSQILAETLARQIASLEPGQRFVFRHVPWSDGGEGIIAEKLNVSPVITPMHKDPQEVRADELNALRWKAMHRTLLPPADRVS